MTDRVTGLELRSEATSSGELKLDIIEVTLEPPGPEEVIVHVEAAPINPSDLFLMLGPADLATMRESGTAERPALTFNIPASRLPAITGRLDQSLPVGNEGAGTVIAAGSAAHGLLGRKVAMLGGAMFTQYRKLRSREVVALPGDATAADGAAMFVNPLTALGFVETARAEGHGAIVHTAAASNLGQMLNRICLADGIPLVNIVRSPAQAKMLAELGAPHVVDSSAPEFRQQLVDMIAETGATIAFDAIGGGSLGSTIVQAMEQAALRSATEYSRYGSDIFKQLYIYGALDLTPTTLNRLAFGFQWSVSGWLLMPFMRKAGEDALARLRQRVLDELTTTFGSHYTATIGLADALRPDMLRAYERKATGEKFLIDPSR